MGTAIFVILALLAVGIILDQLLRLRAWLKKPPPEQDVREDSGGKG